VEAYDGSHAGPRDAPATLLILSPDAIRRIVTAPGELGIGRAYVAGDLDVRGDVFFALAELRRRLPNVRLSVPALASLARLVGRDAIRPLPPPPEEADSPAGAIRASATRPPSRTTTTSRTSSTG
jgi:cyclopropane-fatty-acyl-phospholipid synthase